MLILNYLDYINSEYRNRPLSAAIGNFDGCHQGHQMIINKAVSYAREKNILSAVITFKKHPRLLLNKQPGLITILSPEEKITKLKEMNVDICIFLPENIEFLSLPPSDFINEYLISSMKIKKLFVGQNFHFGKKAEGNTSLLKDSLSKADIAIDISTLITMDNETISSSRIRTLIAEGKLSEVNSLLNYNLFHKAIVIKGDQIGRTIEIPTANLDYHIPDLREGVYKAYVWHRNNCYKGLLFIGSRPTLNKPDQRMEIHILKYSGPELYGETLYFKTCNFIRKNIKFINIESLKKQIMIDIKEIEK